MNPLWGTLSVSFLDLEEGTRCSVTIGIGGGYVDSGIGDVGVSSSGSGFVLSGCAAPRVIRCVIGISPVLKRFCPAVVISFLADGMVLVKVIKEGAANSRSMCVNL